MDPLEKEPISKNISEQNDEENIDTGSSYHAGANILKFWLMPFVCFASFGFPGAWGGLISRFSLFAPNAFFILCGFFLAAREEKEADIYGRTLKRTFQRFLIMFAVCFACNFIIYLLTGTLREVMAAVLTKRTIFNFIVLSVWPFMVGETIWFIQSLLYARIVLWLMNKYGLMRFYKPVMLVCIALMLLFGEFSGVIHFSFHGYTYIPANVITRALPYMLLGRWLYEKKEKLFKDRPILYVLAFVLGIAFAYGEVVLLGNAGLLNYTGHLIGFGIMAFSICCFFLRMDADEYSFAALHGRNYAWRIYLFSQPLALVILLTSIMLSPAAYNRVQTYGGIIVYLNSLLLAYLTGYIRYRMEQSEGVE